MTLGLAYWIIMLIWLLLGPWWPWAVGWPVWPHTLILFLLLVILGWHDFGPPLRG